MKTILTTVGMMVGLAALAAEPVVSVTSVTQADDESVTVTYELSGADAVVTMDVFQNDVSIGDAALWAADGDVNRKVAAGVGRKIVWRPDISWPGHRYDETSIQVKLRAWPLDDTPDYMIVDLMENSDARIRYYTSTNAIPMGLMYQEYRISKMVFKKIKAKGVVWQMGTDDAQHEVTLSHNYYIGVFELTEGQFEVLGAAHGGWYSGIEWRMRAVCYSKILTYLRGTSPSRDACSYPNPPGGVDDKGTKSVLATLRARVGDPDGTVYDFDLPGEAEWEFAARGGHGNGFWGDGSPVATVDGVDANLSRLARYAKNGGTVNSSSDHYTIGPTNAVAIVGSYAPNSYGLYDVHGNVTEICLDGWAEDITSDGGAVISAQGTVYHPVRGGAFSSAPGFCEFGVRSSASGYADGVGPGCRLCCHAGLQ